MENFTTTLIIILITTIAVLLVACLLQKQTLHKNSPPSPLSLPIIGHLHLIKKPLHHSLGKLTARYGPIISLRFGLRPVLVVSSASLADECFSKNDTIFANRPHLLAGKHLGYNYTTITWASYGQHWRNMRRISTIEIFSLARLNSFEGVRREEVKTMIEGLVRDCKDEVGFAKVEMKSRLFDLVLNVMMRMIANKRYYGADVREIEEAKRFREMVEETFEVSGATNLADFFPSLRLGEGKLVRLHRKRDAFMQTLVDEHRWKNDANVDQTEQEEGEEGKGKKSVIDVLLSLQKDDPEYYTDDIIKGAAGTLLAAGTDTSMVTIEWALSLLLNHPSSLSTAQTELSHLVNPQPRLIAESDLPNLPFLHAIINETLRLHPPAPIIPAHESSQNCHVGGFFIPRGTMLLVNAGAIQRDGGVWVEPNSFKPERWLEKEANSSKCGFMPFGVGRRGCPGEGLAMRVVALALGALIQGFEWGSGGEEVDLREEPGLVVKKKTPLVAFCRPRGFLKDALKFYRSLKVERVC